MIDNLKIGDSTISVITYILKRNPHVKSVLISEFPLNRVLQERIAIDETIATILDQSLKIRKKYNLPFWESLSLSMFDKDFQKDELFKEILFHNGSIKKKAINRSDIEDLKDIVDKESSSMFTINSLVRCEENKKMHIPMIDFHIPMSKNNLEITKEVILSMNQSGFILESGKSYHFFGNNLLTNSELEKFLYHVLLFSPITDKNWIAHQLIEKSCNLRFNKKNGYLPKLVAIIN
jgi:hypothetical protein